ACRTSATGTSPRAIGSWPTSSAWSTSFRGGADVAPEALGFVNLPEHVNDGGFDHADVHEATGLTYVAHTANDAIDVIDVDGQRYLGSIPGLPAVAGPLVSDEAALVFTSNRGENT